MNPLDALAFIASLVASLAWPLTVLIVVWIFKTPCMHLLREIQSLKYKDLAIDFSKQIEKVRTDAEQVLPQAPATPTGLEVTVSDSVVASDAVGVGMTEAASVEIEDKNSLVKEKFLQLADLHPAAAILESWLDLETELRAIANKRGLAESQRLPTSKIGKELLERHIWNEDTYSLFVELRELRNTVVHTRAGSITPAQALEYDLLIRRLIAQLRQS